MISAYQDAKKSGHGRKAVRVIVETGIVSILMKLSS